MAFVAWDDDSANATSYVTRGAANTWFEDAIHASAWDDAADDTKNASLVTATRMLDRTQWMGTRTSSTQPLEWPRTGATDKYGVAIANNVIPTEIREATYELALALIENNSLQAGAGGDVKAISTGKTSVEFWTPTGTSGQRLPQIVSELIWHLLASTNEGAAGTSYGTDPDDNPSSFEDATIYDRNDPYG